MSNKRKIYLKQIIAITSMFFVFFFSKNVYATDVKLEAKEYNEKFVEWINLPEEEKENTIAPLLYAKDIENNIKNIGESFKLRNIGASYKYNLRDVINLKIKDQGSTEQCWAFATTTQLESYMALKNGKNVEYSPRHIEYSTASSTLDGNNPNGYNRRVNSGGNAYFAYSYMTSGRGPVLESDMPFVDNYELINLSEIENKKVQAQLKEFTIFPSIYKEKNGNSITYSNGKTQEDRIEYTKTQVTDLRNKIKSHIVTYGSVQSVTSAKHQEFFSNQAQPISSYAYYCDDSTVKADHAISIIGWDDNYEVTNFNSDHRPSSPGAWLIQNSYGTEMKNSYGNPVSVFDNGLLYISYEDTMIEQTMTGIIKLDNVDYEKIYQYDPLGMCTVISSPGLIELYAGNVYNKGSEVEYLTEVGIYTGSNEQSFEIYVNSQDDDFKKIQKVKSVGKTDSDYITVKLDKPIALTGTKFIVAVRYYNENGDACMPIESCSSSFEQRAWSTSTSNNGECFWTSDTRLGWNDLNKTLIAGFYNKSACIKAFTTSKIDPSKIKVSSSKYTISSSDKLIKKVSPDTTVSTFKSNIISNGTINIYDKSNKEVSTNSLVTTGMKLKIAENDNTYDIIVIGDVNGDGKISGTDLLLIKKDIVGLKKLSNLYKKAGDVNEKDGITVSDFLQIKRAVCKLISF